MSSVLIGQDRSVLVSCQAVRLAMQCATAVAGCCGVLPVQRGTKEVGRCLGAAPIGSKRVDGRRFGQHGLSFDCRQNRCWQLQASSAHVLPAVIQSRLAVLAAADNLMNVLHCWMWALCTQPQASSAHVLRWWLCWQLMQIWRVLHCCHARSCRQAPCPALLVAPPAARKA
jgi:hypothetical protein